MAKALPWPVVGLFCAALFGSVISTYNSFLNAASTVFMVDIYKPIFNPGLSDEKTVAYAKNIVWGFAAFAILSLIHILSIHKADDKNWQIREMQKEIQQLEERIQRLKHD